jgi:hypothetical protein
LVSGWSEEERCVLLRVDLEGRTHVLREQDDWMVSPAQSPDGRHVAYAAYTFDSNVWLLENF